MDWERARYWSHRMAEVPFIDPSKLVVLPRDILLQKKVLKNSRL